MMRSNSKASSNNDKKSPQIRPQYVNAAMRSNGGGKKLLPHTSVLDISDAHSAILSEIAASGKLPIKGDGASWEYCRDEVFRPLMETLLEVSVKCRSDQLLPNGRWIGAGNPPNADGSMEGVSNGNGLGERNASSSQPGHGGVGTPKTAPSTPLGGDANATSTNNNKKKHSSDSDSDNDNVVSNNSFRRNKTKEGSDANNSNTAAAAVDIMPSVLDKADFESENEYILDQWCSLPGPTFTLQRLAEILLQHRRYHCYSTEHPFGAATIALGFATSELVGIGSGVAVIGGTTRSETPTGRAESEASTASGAVAAPPRSPRSVGALRGEKLQAAIRRCVLVASLEGL